MNRTRSKEGGYVAIIALLIVVAIIAYLSVQQLQHYGYGNSVTSSTTEDNATDPGVTPNPTSALQKARDARSLIEKRSVQDSLYQ